MFNTLFSFIQEDIVLSEHVAIISWTIENDLEKG